MSREFDELAGAFARNSAKGSDRKKILERAKKKMAKLKREEDKENAAKDCMKSDKIKLLWQVTSMVARWL